MSNHKNRRGKVLLKVMTWHIEPSEWLTKLPKYPFVSLREKKKALKAKGVKVIDFSIGDPTSPTPDFIIKAAEKGMELNRTSGYPENSGLKLFKQNIAKWFETRFNVRLDPDSEIFPSLGAKEAVFAFPGAIKGKYIIIPSPGYPPYYGGALAAGKLPWIVPLKEENNFLPDLSSIPEEIAQNAAIMWLNYPNNPTAVLAPDIFYKKAVEFCGKYGIILASDECYSEMYSKEKPKSLLNFTKKGAIVFQSLSKRSNMTGWRVGFMAGDPDIIQLFLLCKENMDSGCANFIQYAAAKALEDEEHVQKMRKEYAVKRKILNEALEKSGMPNRYSDGTFYIWQKIPQGLSSEKFAEYLLQEEYAIVVTPGPALSIPCENGYNPGEGFVRFALVPTEEDTREAAEKIIKAVSNIKK